MTIFIRNNSIFTNSKSIKDKVKIDNMTDFKDYKQEITFLIDKQAKIYYHKIDLMHDHEDLIIENQLKELDVCRLVYDPNSNDTSFCGIPGICASCNVLFDALPFELKSTHLNAIENFVKEYDNIVKESCK